MPNAKENFVNFKVHTQYSICEGAVKIDDLSEFCKDKKIKLLFKKSSRFHYMKAGVPKNKENYVQTKENR